MEKEKILRAIAELRKGKKRNFEQSIDLIINLKNFDIKRDSVNIFVNVPFKVKDKKICAFLDKKSDLVDTITKNEFVKYNNKKEVKKLVKSYDFFIASAKLMPAIATTFGKFLGLSGKMPSPQLGILADEQDKTIKQTLEICNKTVRIKSKEPSLKITIGKENMKDEEISANILAIYNTLIPALPKKIENIKSVMVKLTMSKPKKVNLK